MPLHCICRSHYSARRVDLISIRVGFLEAQEIVHAVHAVTYCHRPSQSVAVCHKSLRVASSRSGSSRVVAGRRGSPHAAARRRMPPRAVECSPFDEQSNKCYLRN